jgi:hypothetical protein
LGLQNTRVVEIGLRLLKNLIESKIISQITLSKGSLTKIADIELVAFLAPYSKDDENLARMLCSLVLNQTEISEPCLAKVLNSCSLMPSALQIIK